MLTALATTYAAIGRPPVHYRAPGERRIAPNVTDDYERWYTEALPNNRMVLSLRSGIDSEVGWALDRLCRLCHNEQFLLRSIPGLTDALFQWPEWYVAEGEKQIRELQAIFSLPPDQERKRRHALESLFVFQNSAVNELNALELSSHPHMHPLLFTALRNFKLDSDSNTEFILYVIELMRSISSSIIVPPSSPPSMNPITILQHLACDSPDRSIIISSLTALAAILSNTSNIGHLTQDSPAFRASLRYLPLLSDTPLVDACLNYLYVHLSHAPLAKAFLLHRDMPSTIKLLVSLLLSEQVEEIVNLDIGGPVHSVPAITIAKREHVLTKEELDGLLEQPEPQRCYEWMKVMFVAKADGELTQVDFWNLYKDVFVPFGERFPLLVASDVIKNVNVVFPQAQAMVLPGPPQKFVVRGVDRRKETIPNERFKCRWEQAKCDAAPFASPGELLDHILGHIASHDGSDLACTWSSCSHPPLPKSSLRKHILTHLPSSQPPASHPSQSDTITLSSPSHTYPIVDPTSRPPPPPGNTTLSYPRPVVDPPSRSLTALLCIRILFRTSFASSEVAPRADADHFGFPGMQEDVEEQDALEIEDSGDSEHVGESRGRQAFVSVRNLMSGVRIRDEVLMGWITEMIDVSGPG